MPSYPTPTHAEAAEVAARFLRALPGADAVLLVNSCARGQALPTSDLDLAVLVNSATESSRSEARWKDFYASLPIFRELESFSRFARVHVDFFDGAFQPGVWDDGGGPDSFELEIGNWVAHGHLLHARTDKFSELQGLWLPYYAEELRGNRLVMVSQACHLDLLRTKHAVERGLYFQAFDSFYKALREFLQGLFIQARIYPLSYSKWLREQLEHLPNGLQIYDRLPPLLQTRDLCGPELSEKAELLEVLAAQCLGSEGRMVGDGSRRSSPAAN